MAEDHVVAVESNRGNAIAHGIPVVDHPGLLEAIPVACKAAGGDHVGGQHAVQSAHQLASIDVGPIREHEHAAQVGRRQFFRDSLADREGIRGVPIGTQVERSRRVAEAAHGDGKGVVGNGGAKDLPGRGTTQDVRARIGREQLFQGNVALDRLGASEHQHQGACPSPCPETPAGTSRWPES
jgi:hypothetical protein